MAESLAIGTPATVKTLAAGKACVESGMVPPKACRQPIEPRAAAPIPPSVKPADTRKPSVATVVSAVRPPGQAGVEQELHAPRLRADDRRRVERPRRLLRLGKPDAALAVLGRTGFLSATDCGRNRPARRGCANSARPSGAASRSAFAMNQLRPFHVHEAAPTIVRQKGQHPGMTLLGPAIHPDAVPDAAGWWTVHRGASPVLATAIHDGHAMRADLEVLTAIDAAGRLREEDPFTGYVIGDVPNRIVCHRSRFEVDLNRPRDGAVYICPEQAWGLEVWKRPPPRAAIEESLAFHDAYYAMLRQMLDDLRKCHGRFVVLDIHSYNHRRGGPEAAPADPRDAPEVNIGTFSMDRGRWAHVVDPFMESLRAFSFRGRGMDVRENVAFEGRGEQARFIHRTFPEAGCAIAVEFKKVFMDEWTGEPDREALDAIRAMIRSALPVLAKSLEKS